MKEEEEKEEEEEKWKTLAGLSLSRQGDRIRGLELRQSFKLEWYNRIIYFLSGVTRFNKGEGVIRFRLRRRVRQSVYPTRTIWISNWVA